MWFQYVFNLINGDCKAIVVDGCGEYYLNIALSNLEKLYGVSRSCIKEWNIEEINLS